MITNDDLDWWIELSGKLEWTWARTYAERAPHWYVVLGRTEGITREDFVRAARVIHTFGEPGKFYSSTNVYLSHGDWRWWQMDTPLELTDLINRCKANDRYGPQNAPVTASGSPTFYDTIGAEYDSLWQSEEDLAENEELHRLVTRCVGATAPSILDVGCGTGLNLDLKLTHPSLYTGIDPSQAMLNKLVMKHSNVKYVWAGTAEEVLPRLMRQHNSFDLVLSTFASASYLQPMDYERMLRLTRGWLILMTYKPGYVPDYYTGTEREEVLKQTEQASANALAFGKKYGAQIYDIGQFDTIAVSR